MRTTLLIILALAFVAVGSSQARGIQRVGGPVLIPVAPGNPPAQSHA